MQYLKKALFLLLVFYSFNIYSNPTQIPPSSVFPKGTEERNTLVIGNATSSIKVEFPAVRKAIKGRIIMKREDQIGIEITPIHPSHSGYLNYRVVNYSSDTMFRKQGNIKPKELYFDELRTFQMVLESSYKDNSPLPKNLISPSPFIIENISSKALSLNDWVVIFSDENIARKKHIFAKEILIQEVFQGNIKPPKFVANR